MIQNDMNSVDIEKEKLKIQIEHKKEVRKKKITRNIYLLSALLLLIVGVGIHQRMINNKRAKRAIEKEKNRFKPIRPDAAYVTGYFAMYTIGIRK